MPIDTTTWLCGPPVKHGQFQQYPSRFVYNLRKTYPELVEPTVLHMFSGASDLGVTTDYREETGADIVAPFDAIPRPDGSFSGVLADPPYADHWQGQWHGGLPKPKHILAEAVRLTAPGGLVAILHIIIIPAYRALGVKRIALHPVLTGPNNAIRVLNVFRVAYRDAAGARRDRGGTHGATRTPHPEHGAALREGVRRAGSARGRASRGGVGMSKPSTVIDLAYAIWAQARAQYPEDRIRGVADPFGNSGMPSCRWRVSWDVMQALTEAAPPAFSVPNPKSSEGATKLLLGWPIDVDEHAPAGTMQLREVAYPDPPIIVKLPPDWTKSDQTLAEEIASAAVAAERARIMREMPVAIRAAANPEELADNMLRVVQGDDADA